MVDYRESLQSDGATVDLGKSTGVPQRMSETSASPQSTPAEDADRLIGRTINDRYRVIEAIGHGGMGRVYKALQSPLDRLVALKVLGAGHDRDPNFYKRFFLEASVTARLTHPNTITLYDYGRTEDGIFFIAMEYLNGRTLSHVVQQQGALSETRVVHVLQQICRSLREAHALGIIHRDLKPANVMLLQQHDDDDFVKVLDFGLVKFFQGDSSDGEITNAGTFMGSPHYVAPEQARNQAPDQRCDIYSLGVLAFYMLTGTVPFTAPNPVDIILKHLHELPPRPSEQRPELHIDASLEEIVLRCMAKDRAERFQSMDELLGELKNVRQRLAPLASATPSYATPLAVTPLTTPPPPPADSVEVVLARWPLTRRELIRYGAIAAAVVSVGAIAAGALFARGRAHETASTVTEVTTSAPARPAAATPASGAPAQGSQPIAATGIAAKMKQLLKSKQRPAQKEPARSSVGYRDDPYR